MRLDAPALRRHVPDLADREVFLCGPDAFSRALAEQLQRAGVDDDHLHFESFTF